MAMVADPQLIELARRMRRLLAAYRDAEDLIQVGAYARGSDPVIDEAIVRRPDIETFLCQDAQEVIPMDNIVNELEQVMLGEMQ